jgi:hypothetical protein
LVVADLAEDPKRGVENALLRALAPGADSRVVRERRAPKDGTIIGAALVDPLGAIRQRGPCP